MDGLHPDKKAGINDAIPDPLTHHGIGSRSRQEGRVSFSQVIMVAAVFILGMQGLKFISPWYDNLRLKGSMQESVNQAQLSTDGEMISTVLAKAKELQLPLDSRNLHVERNAQGGTRLWAQYEVTLSFPFGFSHTQTFRPDVVKPGRN